MMFREKYRSINEQIFPEQELVNNIIRSVEKPEGEMNKAISFFHKPAIIISMLAVLVLAASPVLAANVPAVNKLMRFVNPAVAQFFTPVQKSCEDNGIKMEVVSVYIHGNTAEIYITMQDLTADRVDETTDLYDSYSIDRPFDSSATCQRVGYDKATKTATFLISITEQGNKKINGSKIGFSVREFLSGKREYNEIPVAVDFTGLNDTPSTRLVPVMGGSGPKFEEFVPKPYYQRKVKVLAPSAPMDFPVEGIDFTGIGYVDGKLHLQTAVLNNMDKDNHGYFFLSDRDGDKVQCIYNVGFNETIDSNNIIHYEEYVFDIPQSKIGQYSLYGTFVTSRLLTEGNWKVTFPLKEIKSN